MTIARWSIVLDGLIPLRFGPSLGRMITRLLVCGGGVLMALLVGCGGKTQQTVSAGPSISAGGTFQVDRTRCDERGKQVQTADTNNDKKPDVTKLYEVRGT